MVWLYYSVKRTHNILKLLLSCFETLLLNPNDLVAAVMLENDSLVPRPFLYGWGTLSCPTHTGRVWEPNYENEALLSAFRVVFDVVMACVFTIYCEQFTVVFSNLRFGREQPAEAHTAFLHGLVGQIWSGGHLTCSYGPEYHLTNSKCSS